MRCALFVLVALALIGSGPAGADVPPGRVVVSQGDPGAQRGDLPELDTGGLTEAPDVQTEPVVEKDETVEPAEEVAAQATVAEAQPEASASESLEMDGKIENGRRFVWAAYGVSWLVLLAFSFSVIRRWKTQLGKERHL